MGYETLVKEKADGGAKLIARLRGADLTVAAACWAKREGDSQWYLFLVSPGVERTGVRPGYGVIRSALESLESDWGNEFERVDLSEVKLVGKTDPLGEAVVEFNRHFPGPSPTWHNGVALGSVYVEGAYIYPPTLFAARSASQTA